MRIALTIYGSLDTVSGGYLYDRKMVEALRNAGHEVDLLTLPWRSYSRHLADNLSPAWRRRLRGARVDLHLQDELNHPSLAWANRWALRGAPSPIVTIVHHLRSSEEHPRALLPLYAAVEKRFLRGVDGFICNSCTTLLAVTRLAGEPERSLVVLPAADHVEADGLVSLHEVAPAPLRILFVGNISRRKGLHTLVHALTRMQRPARLTVAGSESVEPRYAHAVRRLAARLGVDDRIEFCGRVDDVALWRQYGRCHCLALPSYEGFGIAYLEAMAFGRPVIASTAGAAFEIVTDGVEGFLVAPDDADTLAQRLDQLAADRTRLLGMGDSARARFERHPTWQQSGERLVRWLEEWAA